MITAGRLCMRTPCCTGVCTPHAAPSQCPQLLNHSAPAIVALQQDYDLGWVDRVEVVNRPGGFLDRIMCWQLELQDLLGSTLYSYPFTAAQSQYTFRDPVTDSAFQASCNLSPPPPPMPPRPVTPRCPGAAGEYVRFLRFTFRGSSFCPAGQGFLQVTEARLIYNGYNVALGQAATAANSWANSAAYAAGQSVDGKTTTFYHSLTNDATSYLLIDLQVR